MFFHPKYHIIALSLFVLMGTWACTSADFPVPDDELPEATDRVSIRLARTPIQHSDTVVWYPPRGWSVLDFQTLEGDPPDTAALLPAVIEDTREEHAIFLAWDGEAVGFPPYLSVSVMNMALPSYDGWLGEIESMLSEIYRQRFDNGDGSFALLTVGHIAGLGEHTLELRYRYRYEPEQALIFVHELYLTEGDRTVLMTCHSPIDGPLAQPSWCLRAFQGVALAGPSTTPEEEQE